MRETADHDAETTNPAAQAPSTHAVIGDIALCLLLLVIGGLTMLSSLHFTNALTGPGLLPFCSGILIAALALVRLSITVPRVVPALRESRPEPSAGHQVRASYVRALVTIALFVVYVLILPSLGFIPASLILIAGVLGIQLGFLRLPWRRAIIPAVGLCALILVLFLIFTDVLYVGVP